MAAWGRSLLVLTALTLATGCTDQKKKMQEAQKKRDAEKKAFQDSEEAKRKAAAPKIEAAKLEPFWGDPKYVRASTGRPCPDGMWSLFPGTPGEGKEQDANEQRREELIEKVRAQTYVAVLSHGGGVSLRKYNAKKKTLTVEVDGVLECFDGLGLLSFAWGDPVKPFRPPAPDDDEEEMTPQAVWRAQPLLFPLPFATAKEAKAFIEKEGIGIDVRLVFTLGKVDVDKKTLKTARPLPDAGAVEEALDWGAGRLVRVNLLGVRVATDHEKKALVEQKKQ